MAPTTRAQARIANAYRVLELDPENPDSPTSKHSALAWSLNTAERGISTQDPRVLKLHQALHTIRAHSRRPLSVKQSRIIKKTKKGKKLIRKPTKKEKSGTGETVKTTSSKGCTTADVERAEAEAWAQWGYWRELVRFG